MDLKALKDTPPWDWPTGTRKLLLNILRDDQSAETDRLLASELAGDFTVISDDVADALLSILRRGDLSEVLRSQAAISLGPVLDHTDTEGYGEDSQTVLIAERTSTRFRRRCRRSIWMRRSQGCAAADPGSIGTRATGLASRGGA